MDSILTSIKKLLGIEDSYTHFDNELIIHINTAIMSLTQIGVGPEGGYYISSKADLWSSFIGTNKMIEAIKTYIYLKVRLMFDPPSSAFVLEAMERQIAELEWRINVQVDKEGLEIIWTTETGEEEVIV